MRRFKLRTVSTVMDCFREFVAILDKENDKIVVIDFFRNTVVHNLTDIEIMCRYCEVEAFGILFEIEF